MAPKPPPTAVGIMRTCLGSDAENSGNVGAVHVGGLGAGLNLDLVADAPRKAGFRLDVGVLDEASFVFAFDDNIGFGESFLDIAPHDAAPDQHIVFTRPAWISSALELARCFAMVVSAGNSSHVTGNVERSSASIISASPTTAATASPRNRASASAKTG